MIQNKQLSNNFWLYEFLNSSSAQRFPDIMKKQYTPSSSVVNALEYQAQKLWQPTREWFGCPFIITSGYRCLELNKLVGSKPSSQHVLGEAVDCEISTSFLSDSKFSSKIEYLNSEVVKITGKPLRSNLNANFYLFVYICINIEKLDIDQVIHEFGNGPGNPAWIHASSSSKNNKRQILCISNSGTKVLTVKEALLLGC